MVKKVGVVFFVSIFVALAPGAAAAIEFQAPGTNTQLDVGGYVKLDMIYNDVSSGDDSQSNIEYTPGDVPLDGTTSGEKSELVFNARESRLWIKTSTPTDMGPMKTHLEFDFDTTDGNQLVSNSRHGRIRHAYGTLKNWLFGTTWSLFMHLDSLPEINDFGGPTGSIFVRQPQIRYTLPLNDMSSVAFGIENSETYYDAGTFKDDPADPPGEPSFSPAADDGMLPDLIVRYNMNPNWGNLSASVMIRQLTVDDSGTNGARTWDVDDSAFTLSGQVGGVYKIGANDTVKGALSFGDGLGRYSSLATHFDAVISSSGDVEGLQQFAGFAAYEHIWGGTMKWRSNLVLGYSKADDPSEIAKSDQTEQTFSVHANLLMNPVPGARLGIEYLRGQRETYSGKDGDLNRLQFSAMFVF